jgi:protein-disulfide isomerase
MMNANAQQRNRMMIIGGIVVVAVVAVLALIWYSTSQTASTIDYSQIPQSRTSDGGFVLGNPDAFVTIIEFADYGCPHCQNYKPTVDQFIREYVQTGKAKFELRIFPTAGGQLTYFIGQIATCLENQRQGAFWEAGELFFQKAIRGLYNQDTARTVTQELGLNYSEALSCSNTQEQIATDIALGQQLGVNGTPALLVRYGDETPFIIGEAYDNLVEAVAQAG